VVTTGLDLWAGAGPWLALVLLGAFHGINPAMGWLFAVALGLQRRSRRALLGALLPLALGHEAAVGAVVLVGLLAGAAVPPGLLRPLAAVALILFGAYKLIRPRSHPRWVGMRLGPWDLALWSFLMSSAHGAGLMLLPVLLGRNPTGPTGLPAAHVHAGGEVHFHTLAEANPSVSGLHLGQGGPLGAALLQDGAAVALHSLAMLLTMGAVAILVYEKLGLTILRRAWVNVDALWAIAVLVAGVFTLFT
jgi:hypothetical protein